MTFGSVESWGTDLGIIKDPPKSIMTRRIDKVGDTQNITEMIDDSGDRACEAIMVYARGRNPMVGVEYSNYGTAGGQNRQFAGVGGVTNSSVSSLHSGQQAYLPYTIMKDGAFRPPVLRQEQLLPLSRQPRVWTSSFSNPEFPAYVAKTMAPSADKIKAINVDKLQTCVRPTTQFSVEKPLKEGFRIKSVIDNPIHAFANAKVTGGTVDSMQSTDLSRVVDENPLQTSAHSGVIAGTTIEPIAGVDTARYTQDHRYYSQSAGVAAGTADNGLSQRQASVHLERTMPVSAAHTQAVGSAEIYQDHAMKDLQLESNRPHAVGYTNREGHGSDSTTRSGYNRLAPKLQPGGFVPNDGMSTSIRGDLIPTLKQSNNAMRQAHRMQLQR